MLNSALAQSGWEKGDVTANNWRGYVLERLESLDWTQAFADVQRFLMNQEELTAFKKEAIRNLLRT
jgi:hypothetical protein